MTQNNTSRQSLTVVKVGGAVVEDDSRLAALLDSFSRISGAKILVHGGGRSATKIAAALGIESKMVDGRRITDAEMLRVVTMVYGGLVNKNVVAQLQARGENAVGLTGADMDVIRSHKRPVKDVDYGFVGDVDRVDAAVLQSLINQGATPVMAPLTHDGQGHILNTNADTIAAETAKAMSKSYDVTLVYAFEKKGVLANPDDDNSVIRHINKEEYALLKNQGAIAGGMVPKLDNAFSAIERGVGRVAITANTDLTVEEGTILSE